MKLYDVLKKLDIEFEEIEHEPLFTIEQAQLIKRNISGIGCKNLFLTDKKDNYVLCILEENKRSDINQIGALVGMSHLSFADVKELQMILKLEKGSVTPFGILNDTDNRVLLVIDKELKGKRLLFHPNINTKTISVTYDNLIKFIKYERHNYILL